MSKLSGADLSAYTAYSAFESAGESNAGLVRSKNEDHFCLLRSGCGSKFLAAVADGIGGHNRGEMASYICCRELAGAFFQYQHSINHPDDAKKFLDDEIRRINNEIHLRNISNRTPRPMGTTVTCALFLPDSVTMINAGDSRLYQWDPEKKLIQLSTDHSFKTKSGIAENVIYRAVGLHRYCVPEIKTFDSGSSSRYFLCTDGMYRYLSFELTADILQSADSPRVALNRFMRNAMISGGRDNITGITVFRKGEQPK